MSKDWQGGMISPEQLRQDVENTKDFQHLQRIRENWTETDKIVYKTPEIKLKSEKAAMVDFIEEYRKWRSEPKEEMTIEEMNKMLKNGNIK